MGVKKKGFYMLGGGIAAVTLLIAGAFVFVNAGAASGLTHEQIPAVRLGLARDSTMTGRDFGPGGFGDGGFSEGDYLEALAEALGITVDELEDALQAAHEAALKDAVKDGRLTQEQADQFLERTRLGDMLGGGRGYGVAPTTYLAQTLGISEDVLESAIEKAHQALLDEALAEGAITEEQVEMMKARQALAPYMQEAMEGVFESAVNQALEDGAITAEQAELLLESPGMSFPGPGGRVGFGGRGRMGE